MDHRKWETYLSICRKVETGGRNVDAGDAADRHRDHVTQLGRFLPPPARILAPGAMGEALVLAERGYEVHAPALGPDNIAWLEARRKNLRRPELLVVREMDAHDLDYPKEYFDGYFSEQFHEHLISWFMHLGEVRYCMRPDGYAFVDACGITDDAYHVVWHTNLVPERDVKAQWEHWGFKEVWRGPYADHNPQFVFQRLSEYKDAEYQTNLQRIEFERFTTTRDKWDLYLDLGRRAPGNGILPDDDTSAAEHRGFIATFRQHLPPPATVLCPGGLGEALLLAEAGYETHVLTLDTAVIRWLEERRGQLPDPDLLIVREQDAHDLDYPREYFDGYFSVQTHEHLQAPFIHLGEVRYCSRPGAIAFVDACGTTNTACRVVEHINLVNNTVLKEQWEHWGFAEQWWGPHGNERPQYVFQMLPADDPGFKYRYYMSYVMRLRDGEHIDYAYNCKRCGK